MSLFTALLLAAAPALTPPPVESKPVVPAARPAETTVSVGMGQVRKGGALGAGLSLTRGGRPGAKGTELTAPNHQDGAFLAAVACVLRWLQPRDQRVFTFVGATGEPSPVQRPDAGTPPRLTLGWGVEF